MDDIQQEFQESATLKLHVAATQADLVQAMIDRIWDSLQQGGKLLLCGNGGSASDAQHLATECVVRLQNDRCPLPAMALASDAGLLTAAGNDYGFESIFVRQVAAFGHPGDVLLVLSTSGNSVNVVRAVEEARRRDLWTLALLGKGGGAVAPLVHLALVVPSANTQRIQEVHMTIGHIVCGALERRAIANPLAVPHTVLGGA